MPHHALLVVRPWSRKRVLVSRAAHPEVSEAMGMAMTLLMQLAWTEIGVVTRTES
jgi:hypothetical protein